MNTVILTTSGVVLSAIGIAKIALHLGTMGALDGSLCLAGGAGAGLLLLMSEGAHCWGCPVAAAGIAAMAAAGLTGLAPRTTPRAA